MTAIIMEYRDKYMLSGSMYTPTGIYIVEAKIRWQHLTAHEKTYQFDFLKFTASPNEHCWQLIAVM